MSFPAHILVASDGSPDAVRAASVAAALAAHGGRVTVLGVVSVPPTFLDVVDAEGVRLAFDEAGDEMTSPAVAVVRAVGIEPEVEHRRIGTGSVAREIASAASDLGCDVIVVGSHGSGRFARTVLGSVSGRLAAIAHCPVLVVPPPDAG